MSTAASTPQEVLAQRVRRVLSNRSEVREVRMFGGLSFMVDGQLAVAANRSGDLLVRVDPADYVGLLQRGGEPALMGTARPMGEGWLTVPGQRLENPDELVFWIDIGVNGRSSGR